MSSTFQNDSSAALLPLLSTYNISSVTVTPNGQSPFVVSQPVVSPPATGFDYGWNPGGTWATNSALQDTGINIAQFLSDANSLGGLRYVRVFDTSNNLVASVNTSVAQRYAASGVKVIATYNLQNSPVRCKVPSDYGAGWANGLASSSASGIWAIELVNEHDNPTYNVDSPENLAQLFSTMTPILVAKGYRVIFSNALNSLGWYTNSTVYDVIQLLARRFSGLYIGRHGYASTASVALADISKVLALAGQLGIGYIGTECGLKDGTPSELTKLWQGLRTMGGIHCGFTFYNWSDSAEFNSNPFLGQGTTNAANFAAMKAGLGV